MIDDKAFYKCQALQKITLPNAPQKIGGEAFRKCGLLENLSFPVSLREIGDGAFAECRALKEVRIPKSITSWGREVFGGAGIEKIEFEDGVESIPDYTFMLTNVKEVTLPSDIKSVGLGAFYYCRNLEKITLNTGLVSIDNLAFGMTKITEVVIPSTVKEVTEGAFVLCEHLGKIKFEGNAPENFLVNEGSDAATSNTEFHGEYTVCYHKDAKGFTSPTWNGYTTEIW